jgi:spore coat protein U-like protein
MKKILFLLILMNLSVAQTTTTSTKATSKLSSSCKIDAGDLNFGVIGNVVGETTPASSNVNIL